MLSYLFPPMARCLILVVTSLLPSGLILAQEESLEHKPIPITVRVFQARIKKEQFKDLSDQLFRLTTANLTDYEKWITGLRKAYPGFEIELLQTHPVRVFKSPRPAIIYFGHKAEPNLELLINAANSPGDGFTPGLSIIPQVEYHYGTHRRANPVSLVIQPFEAEVGYTYFFTANNLTLEPQNYVNYFRPGTPAQPFQDELIFIIFALSIEPERPSESVRSWDEKQSASLQAEAVKKVAVSWPEPLRQAGLMGRVQVQVQIAPDGRVTQANIYNSTLPEAHKQVLEAVRQWEFSKKLFAEDQRSIRGLLTFIFGDPAIAPQIPTQPAK